MLGVNLPIQLKSKISDIWVLLSVGSLHPNSVEIKINDIWVLFSVVKVRHLNKNIVNLFTFKDASQLSDMFIIFLIIPSKSLLIIKLLHNTQSGKMKTSKDFVESIKSQKTFWGV